MSDIIPIPPPLEHVLLETGIVSRGEHRGCRMFWLDFVDKDGAAMIVWSGFTRSDALAAAREWTKYGPRLIDRTGGAHD